VEYASRWFTGLGCTIADSLIALHVLVPRWQVLRSYDSRFRETNRSSAIYNSIECHSIVGEGVHNVLNIATEGVVNEFIRHNDNRSEGRTLEILATPYREGGHEAKSPKAFLPIIAQLEELHEKGFVHGDIRSFNTVFGESEDDGWLIDFDFGGRAGETVYPKGYRMALEDGHRLGESEEEIRKWHDWHALMRLMFTVHRFHPPDEVNGPDGQMIRESWELGKMNRSWERKEADPTPDEIEKLKELLCRLHHQGWTVQPSQAFKNVLARTEVGHTMTNQGATGSPPQKNA